MSKINLLTIESYLETNARKLEREFDSWLLGLQAPRTLVKSIRYSLLGGGKRIRPSLVLATVNCLHGDEQLALPFACAIELIHTYSLIHDDLPCMDNDDYRRGKLTSHKVFGEAHAVLTGDALFTEAYGWMSRAVGVDPKVVLTIIQEGVRYAGSEGMVGGQVLDIEYENREITKEELDSIHTCKTADLMVYAVRTGAHLCHSSENILNHLTQYALCLGLAFQIQDDILDVIGDTCVMGKQTGSDIAKNTYPLLYGLKDAQKKLHELTQAAKESLEKVAAAGFDTRLLLQLSDFLLTRNR